MAKRSSRSNSDALKLKVLPVRQPIGEFFIAAMPAHTLADISYADVRRLAEEQRDVERYLGIQRPLSTSRVNEIRRYIHSRDATFPTAVILAVDEKCATLNADRTELSLFPFEPEPGSDEEAIPRGKIAKVLDGQHRIAGFLDGDQWRFDFNESFDINVAIFIGADLSEQANIFATVNLAQTKVNRSLVYDLTELAETPSPYKTAHNIAVALDTISTSPLRHRIKRLGVRTPGRSNEPLTQATFVESLVKLISKDPVGDRNRLLDGKRLLKVSTDELNETPFRNMFIGGNELEIGEIVLNYFRTIEQKWPIAWSSLDTKGNILPRANAFKAFMRYLQVVYPKAVNGDFGKVPTPRSFRKFFDHIQLSDKDFTSRNFLPGSGGQAMFFKVLTGEVDGRTLWKRGA